MGKLELTTNLFVPDKEDDSELEKGIAGKTKPLVDNPDLGRNRKRPVLVLLLLLFLLLVIVLGVVFSPDKHALATKLTNPNATLCLTEISITRVINLGFTLSLTVTLP